MLDLGAAPGGWTQVAVERSAPNGRVVAVDLLPMDPVPGATVIQGDWEDEAVAAAALAALGGSADLVLSDMAPNTTGHGATDHLRILGLAELALETALAALAPGGGFVAEGVPGRRRAEFPGRAEARLPRRAPCEAAGQPQGQQRALRGRHRLPRPRSLTAAAGARLPRRRDRG